MYVNIPIDMPESERRRWDPLIAWTEHIVEAEKIDCGILQMHWHPANPWACGIRGEAHAEELTLVLCGTPCQRTMLHELAHLEAHDGHGVEWARRLMELHRRWLAPRRALRADRSIAYCYPAARKVFALVHGPRLPLRGGGKESTDASSRWKFRNRVRTAAARRHERLRTVPYPWEVPGGLG